VPDIFSYELVEALGLPGCALCRALAADDRRWVESFWREGRQDADARRRFFEAGGFCRRHAWLLHEISAAAGSGAAIADLYGQLAAHDLGWLERAGTSLVRRRRRRPPLLRRRRRCAACQAQVGALERKAHFLVAALGEEEIRDAYRRSEGLCFAHLGRVVDQALANGDTETAIMLLGDWRRRLEDVRSQLAAYDRKRDYRYADEPRGAEQRSWTDVIRRYVGEDRRAAR
jgi:hypothetical protein